MDAGRSLRIERSSHDHPKDGYIPVSQRREKVLRKHTRCPTAFKGLLLEHFLPFGSASARCRPSRSRFIAYSPRLPAWHQRRWSGQSHLEFRRPTLRRKSKMSAIDGCRSPEVAERRERPRNRRFQALDTGTPEAHLFAGMTVAGRALSKGRQLKCDCPASMVAISRSAFKTFWSRTGWS